MFNSPFQRYKVFGYYACFRGLSELSTPFLSIRWEITEGLQRIMHIVRFLCTGEYYAPSISPTEKCTTPTGSFSSSSSLPREFSRFHICIGRLHVRLRNSEGTIVLPTAEQHSSIEPDANTFSLQVTVCAVRSFSLRQRFSRLPQCVLAISNIVKSLHRYYST